MRCELDWKDHNFDDDPLTCDLDQQDSSPPNGDNGQNLSEEIEASTTHFVTTGTFTASVGAIAVTGIYGLASHDFGPLNVVWLVVAAPLGAIFARYVKRSDREHLTKPS